MLFEGKKFADAMSDMLRSVLRMIVEIVMYETVAKPFAAGIMAGITGGFGGGGPGTPPGGWGRLRAAAGIPGAQEGGWFTRPTLATIAEKEPELVTPLSKLESLIKPPNIIINNNTGTPIKQPDVSFDGENVIIQIEAALNNRIQRRAGPLFDTIRNAR